MLYMVTIEERIPQEHFLRKLESVLDLSFIYEESYNSTNMAVRLRTRMVSSPA